MVAASAPYIAPAKTTDHGTPAEIWECVKRTYTVDEVHLDPAASMVHDMVKARTKYHGPHVDVDGASQLWEGLVYVNPPYGREIPRFTQAAIRSMEGGAAEAIIQLLPLRGASWFLDDVLDTASAICYVRGRLVFLGSIDPYPVDSIVVLWGDSYISPFIESFERYIPTSQVLRAESAKSAAKAGRTQRLTRWVDLNRPIGKCVNLSRLR